jgi:uncharacterized membrane protein YphA (DoxX/SURF4 family)
VPARPSTQPPPVRPARDRWRPWAATAGRVVLGVVLLVAGAIKLPDPAASVRAVRAYDLLPEAVVPAVGYGLPLLEVVVGLLLVAGLATRWAAVVASLLMAAFVIGIASAWARGLTIDCGCFGGGGQVDAADTRYPAELARDAALLALSLFLVRRPTSRWSADHALTPGHPVEEPS